MQSCSETDWRENYRESSKAPFGTYIIHNEIENLFDANEIIFLKENITDYFDDIYYDNTPNYANYVCIKGYANKLDQISTNRLLAYVEAGNDAFFALTYFNESLKEALNFDLTNLDANKFEDRVLKHLKSTFFLHPENTKDGVKYQFSRNIKRNYFSEFNSENTTVLGTQLVDGKPQPNFIRIKYGNGYVYLHSQPVAFTNYYLLKGKENYVKQVFSFLSDATILWDSQLSPRKEANEDEKKSVFKFFLQHTSLKWSLYVAFIGLLLFLLFNARRKQRAIPVIEKLKNSTVDFTHTIANLYLKEDNHKNLVDKKITYFLERVRSTYYLDTQKLNTDFIEKLASKSGNKLSTTRYLINTLVALHKKSVCTQDELMRLNTLIENFFENS